MKMTAQTRLGLFFACSLTSTPHALAETIQLSDLRLPAEAYAENFYFFDNGFSVETRELEESPLQLPTRFSGVCQLGVNPTGSPTFDFSVKNFTVSSVISNVNRFAADSDGDGPEGGAQSVSGYQFALDLEQLEVFLTENEEVLTTLDLKMLFDVADNAPAFDLYLSYTQPLDEIELTPISTDPTKIYRDLWLPAQSLNEGDVVNGTHRILKLQTMGDQDFSESILALYESGVRQVNLVLVSGGFYANSRQLAILDGAGLMVGTDVAPEPELYADFRLDRGQFGNVATAYDQIIDGAELLA